VAKTFNQPDNINPLSPVGYRFAIENLPNTNWFLTNINLPGISLGEVVHPTPLMQTQVPGNDLIYEPITIEFLVDEDLQAWKEVYNWLNGLGFPDEYGQYAAQKKKGHIYSDATLIILNSNMNPNHRIVFKDLFPTTLSEILFDSSSADLGTIKASVTFRYLTYKYEKV
jgi:hypothetical protein